MSAIVCLLLLAIGLALSGCREGTTEAARPARITLINYNILHGLYDEDPAAVLHDNFEERFGILLQEFQRLRPDVIVLQEVVRSGIPGYPDVLALLKDALPEYEQIFAESGTDQLNAGNIGRMTLTRLPIVSAANRTIFTGRSAHRVTVRVEGGVVDIYNVHMEGPELVGLQELEIVKLLTFIDARRRNLNPVILAGDFNSQPADAAIRRVTEDSGFYDALAAKRDVICNRPGAPGCTRNTSPTLINNPKNGANLRIDYVFARGGMDIGLTVVDAEPFMNEPVKLPGGRLLWISDHIGIKATFELTPRAQ